MTEQEREELVEKMARALAQSHVNGLVYQDAARAALAVAEPVIREQADNVLREEIARLQGLLREAHVKMEANNLWSSFAASRSRLYSGGREG